VTTSLKCLYQNRLPELSGSEFGIRTSIALSVPSLKDSADSENFVKGFCLISVAQLERRLTQREENLDRRLDILDKKEKEMDSKLRGLHSRERGLVDKEKKGKVAKIKKQLVII